VLRRWTGEAWRETDAEFDPRREIVVLEAASRARVPAPEVVAADADGDRCGEPALLLTRLAGDPSQRPQDASDLLGQIAELMELVHSADAGSPLAVPAYRRYRLPGELRPPDDAPRPEVWREAIEIASQQPPVGRSCFIHRDFHPGNLLWLDGRLTGLVDWSYGSWGPAAADLATMRWNLALQYGADTAEGFVDAHRSVRGGSSDHSPYWDVVTILDLLDARGRVTVPNEHTTTLEALLGDALRSLS